MPWVTPETTIEAELAGIGGGWTDLLTDLTDDPIVFSWGIKSHRPEIRVAETGEIRFALNNEKNSGNAGAGQLGYYSLNHASKRSGWQLGIRIRVKQTYAGDTRYKLGYLSQAIPEPGTYEGRRVFCVAVDWMDQAARTNAPTAIQLAQRSDQVFSAQLAQIAKQPAATNIRTGQSTFEVALDNIGSQEKAMASFAKLSLSEFGVIAAKRDATTGETLWFEDRHYRATLATLLVTLDNTMHRLEVPGDRNDILNRFLVTTHPRSVSASIVIAKIETAMPTALAPTESLTVWLDYTDPVQRDTKIGAKNQLAPVATTDYTMNSAVDGTGTDLTSSFSVVATFFASAVKMVITNNHASLSGFVRTLQARGDGIYTLNRVVAEEKDQTSIDDYGENLVQIDMAYEDDPYVGADAAKYLKQLYANPLAQVRVVSFVANQSASHLTAAVTGDVSSRIALAESVAGMTTANEYFINGIEVSVSDREVVTVTWWLTPADTTDYWQVGVVGASEVGVSTRPGF